jgi:hypothetical protein
MEGRRGRDWEGLWNGSSVVDERVLKNFIEGWSSGRVEVENSGNEIFA